jgi:hypothetical protein
MMAAITMANNATPLFLGHTLLCFSAIDPCQLENDRRNPGWHAPIREDSTVDLQAVLALFVLL